MYLRNFIVCFGVHAFESDVPWEESLIFVCMSKSSWKSGWDDNVFIFTIAFFSFFSNSHAWFIDITHLVWLTHFRNWKYVDMLLWCWSNSSLISKYNFWMRFSETREITAILCTAPQKFNVGMHSDIYATVWSKDGLMVEANAAIELCILTLIWLTLTLIKGHSVSKNCCANYLTKSFMGLCRNWHAVETCWCD